MCPNKCIEELRANVKECMATAEAIAFQSCGFANTNVLLEFQVRNLIFFFLKTAESARFSSCQIFLPYGRYEGQSRSDAPVIVYTSVFRQKQIKSLNLPSFHSDNIQLLSKTTGYH